MEEIKRTVSNDQPPLGRRRALTLGRAELSHAVYRAVGVPKVEAAKMVEQVLEEIAYTLAKGNSVKLSSFGIFHVRDKAQRKGRNPKTKEELEIPPRRVVTFHPSHILKARINGAIANDEAQ